MSKIIGIVAVDRNGAIGRGGALPWHYPADMKFFREQTTGNVCVMGRRTWASLKKPLKDRLNVVLTTRGEVEPHPTVVVLRDRASVLSLKGYLACDIYVIGGARVYESFLADIDAWVVTEVPIAVEGADTFMPVDFLSGFTPSDTRQLDDDLKVIFYERR
ncbi:MAG TPA: dihydrofolate reductase [Pyrinomonadaceae bacterium]